MRVGTVFIWSDYPYQKDKKVKNRYFVYLGTSGPFLNPIYIYIATATTQQNYYQQGGKRANRNCLNFKKGKFGFKKDCLIDPNLLDSSITLPTFEKFGTDGQIKELSTLPNEILIDLYKLIRLAPHLIPKIKHDIRNNLNKIGIYGLKKP